MAAAHIPSNPLDRIVLTGFMGSGKTTVGRLLAERLGWTFADLDDRIEAREGRAVPEIFTAVGECVFRASETAALVELLAESMVVIALGGGAPSTPANRELLRASKRTAVIHLHAPFETLYERCSVQALDPHATARPLLGERSATEQRFQERHALYAGLAQHTADATEAPEQVVTHILKALPTLNKTPA